MIILIVTILTIIINDKTIVLVIQMLLIIAMQPIFNTTISKVIAIIAKIFSRIKRVNFFKANPRDSCMGKKLIEQHESQQQFKITTQGMLRVACYVIWMAVNVRNKLCDSILKDGKVNKKKK